MTVWCSGILEAGCCLKTSTLSETQDSTLIRLSGAGGSLMGNNFTTEIRQRLAAPNSFAVFMDFFFGGGGFLVIFFLFWLLLLVESG